MSAVPILETERLILRGWKPEDFDFYAEYVADPEVTRFITPSPTRADAWRNMAICVGHWVLRGYGLWAVERKEDGIFLGRVGLWSPEGWPGIEVGWTLGKTHWNKGYTTEAARASLDHGFRTGIADRFVSHIDRNNHASVAVAKKLGETFVGETELFLTGGRTSKVDRWEITREQWAVRR